MSFFPVCCFFYWAPWGNNSQMKNQIIEKKNNKKWGHSVWNNNYILTQLMDMDVRCLSEIKRQQARLDSLIYRINWLESIAEVHVKWFLTEKLWKQLLKDWQKADLSSALFSDSCWSQFSSAPYSLLLLAFIMWFPDAAAYPPITFRAEKHPDSPASKTSYLLSLEPSFHYFLPILLSWLVHGVFSMWKWFCFVLLGAESILK